MCNIREREAILSTLPESEYSQVKLIKTSHEYGHYASKCPNRERKYKRRFKSRRPRNYLYANEEEEEEGSNQNMSEDELGFIAIRRMILTEKSGKKVH